MAEWTVKTVDGEEPKTQQEQEQAVLDKAVESGEVAPEAAGEKKDEPIKVNLDEPVQEKQESVEGEADDSAAVVEELRDEVPGEQSDDEEAQVIELIDEEEEVKEAEAPKPVPEVTQEEVEQAKLPENVEKLVKFMEETGGTVEDFVGLNKSYDDLKPVDLVREHYKQTKPHLSGKEIDFLLEDRFGFDEDADDREKRSKEIAWKEEVYNAKHSLSKRKDQYYADLKFKKQNEVSPEYKEAFEFYSDYQKQAESQQQLKDSFINKTDKVFSELKGFDFSVGDKKYRYKVNDVSSVKEYQSDINNLIQEFLADDGTIGDAKGYHKAIFAAKNADKIAQHFYEQGKTDALKSSAAKSKNINMGARGDADSVVTPQGTKVRVVSGDSSNKLKINWKPKN